MATVLPAGTSKLIALQDLARRIVGKLHVAELDPALGYPEGLRVRPVDHLPLDVEQGEHVLDVGQALADLAVDHADEVQRLRKLHQHGVDEDEVADRLRAGHHFARRQHHDYGHAHAEDQALAEIQPAQRRPGQGRGLFVARHRAVEALGFHLLVVEIFDGLVVEQRVDRLGVGVGVGIVHLAADLDAPVARLDRVPGVEPHRHRDHCDIDPAIGDGENRCREGEFEDRRRRRQHGEADDRLDALGAALDDPRQAAGAPFEMKAQRQFMHVLEGAERQLPHGVLADTRKQRIAQLVEAELYQPDDVIGHDQHHRRQKEWRQGRRIGMNAGQRICRPFEEIGHDNQHQLGDDQEDSRPDKPRLEVRPVGRPHIGPEAAQGAEGGAGISGNGCQICRSFVSSAAGTAGPHKARQGIRQRRKRFAVDLIA